MELHPRRRLFGPRAFRFVIGPTGIEVHNGALQRDVSWSEIQELFLEQTGGGFSVFATLTGAEQIRLLDLSAVRESPDEVAAALQAAAGGRFEDRRGRPTPNAIVPGTAFTVVLRGFDFGRVDKLVFECEMAMAEEDDDRAVRAVEE
jgi:hypothetical protein